MTENRSLINIVKGLKKLTVEGRPKPQDQNCHNPAEFHPHFNPNPQLNVQADLRIGVFQAVLAGRSLDETLEPYLKKANKLVPPHGYQIEIQQVYYRAHIEVYGQAPASPLNDLDRDRLKHIVKIPHPDDFFRNRALQIRDLDIQVAHTFLERGELETLIDEEDSIRLANGPIFRLVHHFSRTWR